MARINNIVDEKGFYFLQSKSKPSLYLNRYGTGNAANQQNVNAYAAAGTDDQKWGFSCYDTTNAKYQVLLKMNTAYGLDYYRAASNMHNCDINTIAGNIKDSTIRIHPINADGKTYFKFQLWDYSDRYLTVNSNNDVRWETDRGTTSADQLWLPLTSQGGGNTGGGGTLTVGQRPPNLNYNSAAYISNNPFAPTYTGQCTCHAWGRMKEVRGYSITFVPNSDRDAVDWPDRTVGTMSQVSEPVSGCIAVWRGTTDLTVNGHVAYVEKVEGNNLYITESNMDTYYDVAWAPDDGKVKLITKANMQTRGSLKLVTYLIPK